MNPFTYFSKRRREQRKKLKELKQFSSTFSALDRLEQSGLLVWDQKQRRLFISQSLAVVMMRSAETWVNFITNTYQWLYYQQAQEAWNAHFLRAELAAVRRASRDTVGTVPSVMSPTSQEGLSPSVSAAETERSFRPPLTEDCSIKTQSPDSGGESASPLSRADVERIRLAARQQVAESDIEPPKVEPFEFFIVQDTTDAAARLIAVGYFNPETNDTELAPWSEVEPLLKKAGNE